MAAGGLCARCGNSAAAAAPAGGGGGEGGGGPVPRCARTPVRGAGGGGRGEVGGGAVWGGLTAAGPGPAWPRPLRAQRGPAPSLSEGPLGDPPGGQISVSGATVWWFCLSFILPYCERWSVKQRSLKASASAKLKSRFRLRSWRCLSDLLPAPELLGRAEGRLSPFGELFVTTKIKIEMWKMCKGSYSVSPGFSGRFRSVPSFVLSMFFDIYCNVFMLWSVPTCLIFIKRMSISPNGDTNTSVTCDRVKRAFLP